MTEQIESRFAQSADVPEVALSGELVPQQRVHISTPDRRLRVFLSSTLGELAVEREAARDAVQGLRLTPVMFETGARPHPPRSLYRAYLAQSDVFVGIYWERYGWVAPQESVSGLEDEYLLSGTLPKLIYIKASAQRDPRLTDLLARVESDDRASYKSFGTPEQLAELLADDLALLLTERFSVAQLAAPETTSQLKPGFLPTPVAALIGRDDEVGSLAALLARADVRLVSVTGPGGVGKSRLALEVTARLRADGLPGWFVDLARLADPALVPVAVAASFGVRPEGSRPVLELLADRIGGQRLLIVLDSVEHVLAAAPDIGQLLAACPGVTILATTRSALRLRGEYEVAVAPLALPVGAAQQQVAAAAQSPAVTLFVARAGEVRPGFELTASNVSDVVEICRRLDGIPLALELAAAHLRLLSPATLRSRLDKRLDLAGDRVDLPMRQRTLRTTIAWSYDALGAEARLLLARLSVFANGWTLEGAERVAAAPVAGSAPLDVLATMASLVNASLVSVLDRHDGEPRFRLLDTVREFAGERLEEFGQTDAVLANLAAHLLDVAGRAGPALRGPDNRDWTRRLNDEVDDIRRVMRWALDTDQAELAVRLPAPLFTYWWASGLLSPMLQLAEETAALPSARALPPEAAGLLLWCRGAVRVALGRVEEAVSLLRDLVGLARSLGDRMLLAHAATSLGLSVPFDTAADEASALLREGLQLYRELDDAWGISFALIPLGQITLRSGDPAAAIDLHREALQKAELIDNDHLLAQAYAQLGLDALLLGETDSGRNWFALAAEVQRRLLDQEGLAYCLDGFCSVALLRGHLVLAAELSGAAHATRTRVGVAVWPLLRPLTEALTAQLEEALGEQEFARARAVGAQLAPTAALEYALSST